MVKTTQNEKRYAEQWVHRYVNSPSVAFSILQYSRLMVWLNGDTFDMIARDEGVTTQAVARSVKRDLQAVLAFAKANDKDYTNNITSNS